MLHQHAVFVWSRVITTKFLTQEGSRLTSGPFENGSEANRLFVNLKFQKLQGFIQDFELGGGGKQDGSMMIVVCESMLTHA